MFGIWDCPQMEMTVTRTLSSWYGGRGHPLLQDGINATCIVSKTPSTGQPNRMDLGPFCHLMEQPACGPCTTVWRDLSTELSGAQATMQPAPKETWAATHASLFISSGNLEIARHELPIHNILDLLVCFVGLQCM